MSIIPRPVAGSYDAALFDFMKRGEGDIRRVYTDDRGIPTLGLGYALVIDDHGNWRRRDRLEDDLAAIGVTLSEGDRHLLADTTAALNDGEVSRAKALIPEWRPGEDSAVQNRFDFLLDNPQAAGLFDRVRPAYEAELGRRLGPALTEKLAGSHEMVALFSLVYNNPSLIGRGLVGHLRADSRPDAWYEIRFRSNGKRHRGLQNRRDHESDEFGLYNDNPAREETEAVLAFLESHRAAMSTYLAAVHGGQDAGETLAGESIERAQAKVGDTASGGVA